MQAVPITINEKKKFKRTFILAWNNILNQIDVIQVN
jgi:hypothetical protein